MPKVAESDNTAPYTRTVSGTGQHGDGLRSVTRDAVRRRLADVAIDLFAEHGFDGVTVEQVAVAAGVSTRSMHRYFASKEDMVIGVPEAYGQRVRDALAARPAEPVMVSLHAAYAALLGHRPQTERDRVAMRLLASTPSLRARNLEKHLLWSGLLTPIVAERLGGTDAAMRAQVLVQASLAAFTLALIAWGDVRERRSVLEVLDVAFRDLIEG